MPGDSKEDKPMRKTLIIAGDVSGDLHGGNLVKALRNVSGDSILMMQPILMDI